MAPYLNEAEPLHPEHSGRGLPQHAGSAKRRGKDQSCTEGGNRVKMVRVEPTGETTHGTLKYPNNPILRPFLTLTSLEFLPKPNQFAVLAEIKLVWMF